MKKLLFIILGITIYINAFSQDTTVVQTLTFDSLGRDYIFTFPEDTGQSYEKIYMQYRMRCKNALVSNSSAPNQGCGEWDYSCNTFIVDSAYTDSIKASAPSHIITSFAGTTYEYTTQPTYSYIQYSQQNVTYNSVISETFALVGTGTTGINHPLETSKTVSKTQYLWTATELTSAGLVIGDITGLKLNITNSGADAQYLRIKIKQTTQSILNEETPETNGFTEVYFLNTSLVNGLNQFNFYNNFTWDGTSNLLVEFSFTNSSSGINSTIEGHDAGANMALISDTEDKYLEFSAIGNVDISNSDYSSISNEISISFWAYGNSSILPVNTSVFEGVDNLNRRQAHSHLPWGNSKIFWDCGNDGSYDRIYKEATSSSIIKGQWNHWVFTKNTVTDSMKIYYNGAIWHSASQKNKTIDIQNFIFGSNASNTRSYYGFIDDFSIWDTELSQQEIQDWMYKDIDASHPKYSNMINYFTLNEGYGNVINDVSLNNISGNHSGMATWKSHRGKDIFKSFIANTYRPNTTFIQGNYTLTIDTVYSLDSTINDPNIVYAYQLNGTDLEPVDTNLYYLAGNSFVYNESNVIVDTVYFATEDTINITTLNYFNKFTSQFEIMSFVTPYGLFLDLGVEGKMWQFDVSDFKSILNGNKRLYLGLGGQNQEDLDIKFLFISGTPAREALNIQQIWRSGRSLSYQDIMADIIAEPRNITLDAAASTYKIRTSITGHGQEGEFISRTHFIDIDGGTNELEWQVWKECAENPIFPQGGTWIYDRAGWCPGAPTDLQELELENVSPGQTIEVDYGVTSGSGTSKYLVNCQLVTYGAANFNLDAELVEVKYPSTKVKYSRLNPICYDPKITIRNSGATTITSLDITYNVVGGDTLVYNWTGSLEFMQKQDITLPIDSASFWVGTNEVFVVTLSSPNAGQDEYANNNTINSEFILPDVFTGKVYLSTLTNARAFENSYTIKDMYGDVVLSRAGMSNYTYYYDTLQAEEGCFTLEFNDWGNDGLEFWANSAQGAGNLRLKSVETGWNLKAFDSDFGKSIIYSFSIIEDETGIKETQIDNRINIYPNPTKGNIAIDINLEYKTNGSISVSDLTGRIIYEENINNISKGLVNIDLSNNPTGVYYCTFIFDDILETRKIVIVD